MSFVVRAERIRSSIAYPPLRTHGYVPVDSLGNSLARNRSNALACAGAAGPPFLLAPVSAVWSLAPCEMLQPFCIVLLRPSAVLPNNLSKAVLDFTGWR